MKFTDLATLLIDHVIIVLKMAIFVRTPNQFATLFGEKATCFVEKK